MSKKKSQIALSIYESRNTLVGNSGNIIDIENLINIANQKYALDVNFTSLNNMNQWNLNTSNGNISHVSGKFFSIAGFLGEGVNTPIIIQPEIGILGFLARIIDGVFHLLMQLKVEPGNPNGIQLSPTVQATKSNFSRVHGGKLPRYIEYFSGTKSSIALYEQYGSEQGWRYLKKRNRNAIYLIEEDIELGDAFHWMTLGQINELSKRPLLINACSRSVLSLLPKLPIDEPLSSQFEFISNAEIIRRLIQFRESEDQHAYRSQLSINGIYDLKGWVNDGYKIFNSDEPSIEVLGVEVQGVGREVAGWCQPLISEINVGEYGLIIGRINGVPHIFWSIISEPGLWDDVEFSPSWIIRSNQLLGSQWLYEKSKAGKLLQEIQLAEEGGRFFRAIFNHKIIEIGEVTIDEISDCVPMTLAQTENSINNGALMTIEARSLWSLVVGEWVV